MRPDLNKVLCLPKVENRSADYGWYFLHFGLPNGILEEYAKQLANAFMLVDPEFSLGSLSSQIQNQTLQMRYWSVKCILYNAVRAHLYGLANNCEAVAGLPRDKNNKGYFNTSKTGLAYRAHIDAIKALKAAKWITQLTTGYFDEKSEDRLQSTMQLGSSLKEVINLEDGNVDDHTDVGLELFSPNDAGIVVKDSFKEIVPARKYDVSWSSDLERWRKNLDCINENNSQREYSVTIDTLLRVTITSPLSIDLNVNMEQVELALAALDPVMQSPVLTNQNAAKKLNFIDIQGTLTRPAPSQTKLDTFMRSLEHRTAKLNLKNTKREIIDSSIWFLLKKTTNIINKTITYLHSNLISTPSHYISHTLPTPHTSDVYSIGGTKPDFVPGLDVIRDDRSGHNVDLDHKYVRFHRVFNNSSINQGGRFYAPFQSLKKKDRSTLKCNGQATVELDYSCLHIEMLYHLRGLQLEGDAYGIDDPDIERWMLKAAMFTLVFSSNKRKINSAVSKALLDRGGPDVVIRKGTAGTIVKALMKRHRPIAKDFCSGKSTFLQHLDSRIAEKVMLHFTNLGAPCLTVHDSFIVYKALEDELAEAMELYYKIVMSEASGRKISQAPRIERAFRSKKRHVS